MPDMSKATPAQRRAQQRIANTPSNDPQTKFYVQKKYVRPMIAAIMELQNRSDISGKFARKIALNRRALSAADELIIEERKALTLSHAEKFPEQQEDGSAHPNAGKPTPVFQTTQDGKPVFKKDEKGRDTEERVVIPDQYNLANPMLFSKDFDELLSEVVVVECPGFTVDDWANFKEIKAGIVDPLLDLDPAGLRTSPPEGWEQPTGPTLVEEETDDVEEAEVERTAP